MTHRSREQPQDQKTSSQARRADVRAFRLARMDPGVPLRVREARRALGTRRQHRRHLPHHRTSANNVGAVPRLQIVNVGGELAAHGTTVKYLNLKNHRAYLADTYAQWEDIAIGVVMYKR